MSVEMIPLALALAIALVGWIRSACLAAMRKMDLDEHPCANCKHFAISLGNTPRCNAPQQFRDFSYQEPRQ